MKTAATGPLPQFYADRFGWQPDVSVVLNAFRSHRKINPGAP
jgi:hypothetical protein